MYLLYLDESGTVDLSSSTLHFAFLGLAVPVGQWKKLDQEVFNVKKRYKLQAAEIHTAWMLRKYPAQDQIPDFALLDSVQRADRVAEKRREKFSQFLKYKTAQQIKEIRKNFRMTSPYVHLTIAERENCIQEILALVAKWDECRLFAEVVNKAEFQRKHSVDYIFENSFTQVVSRFEQFLSYRGSFKGENLFGLLIQDNNPTVSKRLTEAMRVFHQRGTVWTGIDHIVETPFFVDSSLTGMIQVSDVLAYITRRYFDNREKDLFEKIFPKFDRAGRKLVGIRHYPPPPGCDCMVCKEIQNP